MRGIETYLYITLNDGRMIARASAGIKASVRDEVLLALDGTRLHIFDKETEG